MHRVSNIITKALVWTALSLAAFSWNASTVSAEWKVLCSDPVPRDLYESEILSCVWETPGARETIGLFRRIDVLTGHVEVRQVPGLICTGTGYDLSLTQVGTITATTYQGSVTDCFRDDFGICYTFDSVRYARITCGREE